MNAILEIGKLPSIIRGNYVEGDIIEEGGPIFEGLLLDMIRSTLPGQSVNHRDRPLLSFSHQMSDNCQGVPHNYWRLSEQAAIIAC